MRPTLSVFHTYSVGLIPALPSLSPQFDMQRITLEELKHILYHAFRDHLTMKDIENIIINEEESLNETSGNCQTEFEGGRSPIPSASAPLWVTVERKRDWKAESAFLVQKPGLMADMGTFPYRFLFLFSPNSAFLQAPSCPHPFCWDSKVWASGGF